MINKLIEASQAGVKIDMIVRGICCIIPHVEGYTDNIRVISIVGRYLEHSRIYIFGTGEDKKVTVTSEVVKMNNQQTVVNNSGASPKWSDKYGQYYIEYQKDGKTYKMWMEESKSIEQKLQAAKKAKIAGTSVWKLGMEDPTVWDTIIKYVN